MQGILFKSEMTLANLNGLKSRTSRTRGLHKINENPDEWTYSGEQYGLHIFDSVEERIAIRCPYGKVGSELYGKETYSVDKLWDNKKPSEINHNAFVFYHADTSKIPLWVGRTRSPMMMPEWDSRYHVILEKIIAQRIQSITPEDCIREGMTRLLASQLGLSVSVSEEEFNLVDSKKTFFAYLDTINPENRKRNLWNWGLYYRVVKKEGK